MQNHLQKRSPRQSLLNVKSAVFNEPIRPPLKESLPSCVGNKILFKTYQTSLSCVLPSYVVLSKEREHMCLLLEVFWSVFLSFLLLFVNQ